MPGAARLVLHLKSHAIPMAIATSTMRSSYERKMSGSHAANVAPFFEVPDQPFSVRQYSVVLAIPCFSLNQQSIHTCRIACITCLATLCSHCWIYFGLFVYPLHGSRISLDRLHQAVVCGNEVVNGKPAPDCFTKVAEQMNVPPAECLVFEDSPAGKEEGLFICNDRETVFFAFGSHAFWTMAPFSMISSQSAGKKSNGLYHPAET